MRKRIIIFIVLMLIFSGFLVSASKIIPKKTSDNKYYMQTEDTASLKETIKGESTSKSKEINEKNDNHRYFIPFAMISTSDNFLARAYVQRSILNLDLAIDLQIYNIISGSLFLEKFNGEIIEVGEGSSVYPIGFGGYFEGYKTNDMLPFIWNITKIGPNNSFGFFIFISSPVKIHNIIYPNIEDFARAFGQ